MLQKIRWFLSLTAVLVVVIVAFQNQDAVPLTMLFFSGEYPLTLLLLATAAISFVLGCLMTAWRIRSRHKAQEAQMKVQAKESTDKKADPSKALPFKPANQPNTESPIGVDQEAT